MRGLFVTGTDTGVGKTWVSCIILRQWRAAGLAVRGMKPVASGCRRTKDGLQNDDALALMRAAAMQMPYEMVNPCALEPPIAPHLAARAAGERISLEQLARRAEALGGGAQRLVVEGAGGWRVPLGDDCTMADLARLLGLPVVLVVGMRLGCLNHALLSAAAIAADGCTLAGWVANLLHPQMELADENMATLAARIPAPQLGVVPWGDAGARLNLQGL